VKRGKPLKQETQNWWRNFKTRNESFRRCTCI